MDVFEALVRGWFPDGTQLIRMDDFDDFLDAWRAGSEPTAPGDEVGESSRSPII